MIIAREKRKENIAEYILYMWQVEDIIRAYEFDIHQIDLHVISGFHVDSDILHEMHEWYENLIMIMKNEKLEKSGHCQFLTNLVNELNELHQGLLADPSEVQYHEYYKLAQPGIVELQVRSGHCFDHDVDTCLHGLYGLFLLRLRKKEISDATTDAFRTISKMMACLAAKFKQHEEPSGLDQDFDPGLN